MNLLRTQFLQCLSILCLMSGSLLVAEEFQSPVSKFDLADGDCVVFLGDSITHQRLYTQYVEDYFYTRYPHKRLKFHNSGVGGAKAWDALQRFDRDVAQYHPKYVTILLGMNDGRYQPFNEEIFTTYRNDMLEVVNKIKQIGATPVLMTPTMYDSRAARIKKRIDPDRLAFYNGVLSLYGAWLREIAVDSGYGFVDMYAPLNHLTLQERKKDANFTMIADSVHPGPVGQLVMANAILNDMNVLRSVSNIRISKNAKGKALARATNGKLTLLEYNDEKISFNWHAKSLPLVVPEEAQPGAKLLKLGHRMSKEALEIHNLPPGRYELRIDGEVVGTYPAEALSRHIELQENQKTPQYKQAAQVAEMNKKRNEGPISQLRREWSIFQRWARTKQQLKENPQNEQLKKSLDKLQKQLEGREQRIAKFEKEALEIEDQIFKINQPIDRKFIIQRIK